MPPDLIKRFSVTPFAAVLTLNGVSVRVATNDQLLLDRLQCVSDTTGTGSGLVPRAEWRIVVEEDDADADAEFALEGFTHGGLSFVRIAHRSFLAGDLGARCGISFLDKTVIRNEQLFEQYFLRALTSLLGEMKEAA